jgi:hypothetical protein
MRRPGCAVTKRTIKLGAKRAWAKKHGLDRTIVNKVMHRARPPTEGIIRALGLRIVVISD